MQVFKVTGGGIDKQIKVPSNWGEVTLQTFQSIVAINPEVKDFDKKAIELALLTGERVEAIKSYPFVVVSKIINFTNEFLNVNQEFKEVKEFEHEGQNYIVPEWTYKDMTFGEWMDAQTVIAIKTEIENDNFENAHTLLAVLCRKKGEPQYNSDEVAEVAASFKTLPMDIVFSITSFFLQQKKNCVQNLATFSSHLSREVQKVNSTYKGSVTTEHSATLLHLADLIDLALPHQNQLN